MLGWISATQTSLAQIEGQRKQTESALFESESRFRSLFEYAPLAYQSLDIEGNILDVNQAWLNMVGCSREQALGQFFGDLMTESSLDLVQKTFGQFKQDGHVSSPVFEFVRRDTGVRHLITVEGQIARNSQGVFQHTHCILIDITERKQAEIELHIAATIFESQMVGMMITDASTKIIKVNQAFTRLTGYTVKFVILLEEVSHDEDIARVANEIIHSLGQPFTLCQNHDVTIGASIGIGIHPRHGESVEELMDNADAALYRAKNNGRGCFAYSSAELSQKSG